MTTSARLTDQPVAKKGFLSRLSLWNKLIGAAVLVFLLLLVISIPGDRDELIVRQTRVEAAQIGYELAFPAIEPSLSNVITYIDGVGVDLSANQSYTRLSGALTSFNRPNALIGSRFPSVVTFSNNIHSLLDGENAVPELDTDEFRMVVADMDTTLGVAWIALMELNDSIDGYNSYHRWISATIASALFNLPGGYTDPLPATSRLTRESLAQ